MNDTNKAKLDAAKRMLRGKIDIEEVSMMIGIPLEQLIPVKAEIDEEIRKVYGNVDAYDMEKGTVLFDDFNDFGTESDLSEEE